MHTFHVALVLVGSSFLACGGSDSSGTAPPPGDPYTTAPNTTVVVGPKTAPGNGTVVTTPSGDQCVTLAGVCVKPQDKCKTDRADVVVDSSGKVVEVICYPSSANPTPVDAQGNVDIGKDNKGVVVIDGLDDGVDVAGDVKSNGNNVTVFGGGADVSVIGGSIDANGNNFAARGVRVKGNVTVDGNNAALVLTVVEGDLIVKGNNAVIAGCTVLGQIKVEGNNAVLVGNVVSKGIDAGDKNTSCDGNVDAAGAAINCSTKR